MISIIVCSRERDISAELRKNIRETIGSEIGYEIIVIDNSQNQYSIFEAYNKGVSLSSHPFLLFMHDDVEYRTTEWGVKLMDHFKDHQVGCVGIAGTPYLPYTPGAWWGSGTYHFYLLQFLHSDTHPAFFNFFPENTTKQEVVVLDGVWMCIRKELFRWIQFDETTFDGFHFYDLDITLQAYKAGYKILCVNDILLYHRSIGNFNQKWAENALLFHHKWKHLLPVSVDRSSWRRQCRIEHNALRTWLGYYHQAGWHRRTKIYLNALRILTGFKKGYFYFRTPVLASEIFARYLKNLLLRK
jgi:GT2 family glycosyltransferase